MPSPRTCRKCGKPLLPDLPWCLQWYEPITRFAARAPLHHGDFVGSPIPTGGHIPHWSRWEKSATTFGPVGRVVATMLLFATLLPAIASGGFMYLIAFRSRGRAERSLGEGWVVPDEPDLPPLPVTEVSHPPLSRGEQVRRIIRWTFGLAAILVFGYGPVPAKAILLALAAIVLPWWFFRAFLDR
jgi:hypothetical protein